MSKKTLSVLLTSIILVVFVGYFIINREKFELLTQVNVWLLCLVFLLNIAILVVNGLFTKLVMQPFGKSIHPLESIYVSLISSIGNYFAPAGGGFAFRAVYLKKVHDFSYRDYTATLYGNYILVFIVNSLVALLALYMLRQHASPAYLTLALVFGVLFTLSIAFALLKLPTDKLRVRITQQGYSAKLIHVVLDIAEGWNQVISNRLLVLRLSLLTAGNLVFTSLIALLEIKALHLNISLPALMLFSVLGSLSLFVSVTPANVGIKEAIYLFSSAVIGFSVPQVLSIALLDRGVMFINLVVLWLVMARMGSVRQVRSKITQ